MRHSNVEQTGTERIILLQPGRHSWGEYVHGHQNKNLHKPPLSVRMKFLFESTVLDQNRLIDMFMVDYEIIKCILMCCMLVPVSAAQIYEI